MGSLPARISGKLSRIALFAEGALEFFDQLVHFFERLVDVNSQGAEVGTFEQAYERIALVFNLGDPFLNGLSIHEFDVAWGCCSFSMYNNRV